MKQFFHQLKLRLRNCSEVAKLLIKISRQIEVEIVEVKHIFLLGLDRFLLVLRDINEGVLEDISASFVLLIRLFLNLQKLRLDLLDVWVNRFGFKKHEFKHSFVLLSFFFLSIQRLVERVMLNLILWLLECTLRVFWIGSIDEPLKVFANQQSVGCLLLTVQVLLNLTVIESNASDLLPDGINVDLWSHLLALLNSLLASKHALHQLDDKRLFVLV